MKIFEEIKKQKKRVQLSSRLVLLVMWCYIAYVIYLVYLCCWA
jgi:hypothetical protein